MKKNTLTIAFLAMALAIWACGNKSGEKASEEIVKDQIAETTSKSENKTVDEKASIDERNDDGSVINQIRKEWKT